MKYEDSDGTIYSKYIEPNKPLIISSTDEAIATLELSDVVLTREVKNVISLIPSGTTIALCKIVKRDGDSPDVEDMLEMYEALDYAFEMTENYPIKQIIPIGISLDKAVSLSANNYKVKAISGNEAIEGFEALVLDITPKTGETAFTETKTGAIKISAKRSAAAIAIADDKGIYDTFEVQIDGAVAKADNGDDFQVVFDVNYTDVDAPVIIGALNTIGGFTPTMRIADGSIFVSFGGIIAAELDSTTDINFAAEEFEIKTTGQLVGVGVAAEITREFTAKKGAEGNDILTRILTHNRTITSTMNNCLTFLAPEPPINHSVVEINAYVEKCKDLQAMVRERCVTVIDGTKVDLGMFLLCPVGVNQQDGIGGLYNFAQNTISSITVADGQTQIITTKTTSNFVVGDVVEVYGHSKLNIITQKANVVSVGISNIKTNIITLDVEVPAELIALTVPKYIMNINNKDTNGTYLAVQYAGICDEAGVTRSPAGLTWSGECQASFSSKQVDALKALKYSVLTQIVGTTYGEIERAYLMTSDTSQFQTYENIKTIYTLVEGAKEIAVKYKGKRLDETTGPALVKKEIEDGVFTPAVTVFITAGYDLTLKFATITATNGKKEKALFIDFGVTEIQTLAFIRMTARLY
jgi:hypothetical protein